ncbi:MAG TPA: prephenate dehydrogenase/arogenate dehydrogenase family protein [Longimicrobium sp.]|nr:prephenate dehydrogenase/arogenate dehydrogenase family protein [Longimicrobium sp.]
MDPDHPAQLRTVAIVGLGLIGGSLARELAGRGVRVLGWDADAESLREAVSAGVIQHPLADDLRDVDQADAVVLAVPVLAAAQVLRKLAPRLAGVRLITDVGSTKTSIVREAEALGVGARFVGSHPLAGDHRSGWSASRAGLFDGARIFLCRTRETAGDAMLLASDLWTSVGGRPEVIDADLHDVRLAWTSHLPQVVSTALALTINQTGTPRGQLGPGGRDVTRLAGSDPAMWADILLDNADALASALGKMGARLDGLQRAVMSGDREELLRLLDEARRWHGTDG